MKHVKDIAEEAAAMTGDDHDYDFSWLDGVVRGDAKNAQY